MTVLGVPHQQGGGTGGESVGGNGVKHLRAAVSFPPVLRSSGQKVHPGRPNNHPCEGPTKKPRGPPGKPQPRRIRGPRTPTGPGVLVEPPVAPADLAVLAVGVVVSVLGAGNFVAGDQHRACPGTPAGWRGSCHFPECAVRGSAGRRRDPRRGGSRTGCCRSRPGCSRRGLRCACRGRRPRSLRVKPSWAVMKLTEANDRRPRWL